MKEILLIIVSLFIYDVVKTVFKSWIYGDFYNDEKKVKKRKTFSERMKEQEFATEGMVKPED